VGSTAGAGVKEAKMKVYDEPLMFDMDGAAIAARVAGDVESPTALLLHGFPSSSRMFRDVIDQLAPRLHVVAPDLPGFGQSEPIGTPSFAAYADVVEALLERLGVASYYLYLHDYGAAVGLYLATRHPERIRGLIVQNANAHSAGMGAQWADTIDFWESPTAAAEGKATAHLTLEGTRDQYVAGVPPDVAARIDPSTWEEDWRVMSLPGRLDMQRALVLDYRRHVARFGAIASYLAEHQPPALMIWGRHDAFFDVDETLCWVKALPRMEAHILDGPHFLLETHAHECTALISRFVDRVEATPPE
jgi:pimeloyl-ACP methyl ester carboxylesterase